MPHLAEIVFFIRQLKKITCSLGHITPIIPWISYITTSVTTLFEVFSFNSSKVCFKFGQMTLH